MAHTNLVPNPIFNKTTGRPVYVSASGEPAADCKCCPGECPCPIPDTVTVTISDGILPNIPGYTITGDFNGTYTLERSDTEKCTWRTPPQLGVTISFGGTVLTTYFSVVANMMSPAGWSIGVVPITSSGEGFGLLFYFGALAQDCCCRAESTVTVDQTTITDGTLDPVPNPDATATITVQPDPNGCKCVDCCPDTGACFEVRADFNPTDFPEPYGPPPERYSILQGFNNCVWRGWIALPVTRQIEIVTLQRSGDYWYLSVDFYDRPITDPGHILLFTKSWRRPVVDDCPPMGQYDPWQNASAPAKVCCGLNPCPDVTPGPCDSAGNCAACCTSYTANFDNGGSATFGPIAVTCQWNGTAQTGAITLAVNIVAHDNNPCRYTMRVIDASGFLDFEAFATEANGCPPLTGWVQTAGANVVAVTTVTRAGCP